MAKSSAQKRRKPDLRDEIAQAHELERAGRLDEARRLYEAILGLDPDQAEAGRHVAIICSNRGEYAEALRHAEHSLRLRPRAETAAVYAYALERLGRPDEALAAANRSLILAPGNFAGLFCRGAALAGLQKYAAALTSFERAVATAPHDAAAHCQRGRCLRELGRYEEALAAFARAHELDPALPEPQFNEALTRLLLGDFVRGWAGYETRWRTDYIKEPRTPYPQPHWDGHAPLEDKSLYVYPEQGLGDLIMFSRYLPALARRTKALYFGVDKPLKPLLAGLPGVTTLTQGDATPAFDLQCALLSLPHLLGTRLDTIPSACPYVDVPPERRSKWAGRVADDRPLKVGLVWAGGRNFRMDATRSVGLAAFVPMLADPRIRFVSLNRELRSEDAAELARHPDIVHFGEALEDFADTAAIIVGLDLIISVDTSVAHLAGALGKPVWILLPYVPDFRWLLGRDDSPWYPTATLFRQATPGDWAGVMARVAARIRTLS